MVAAAGQRAGRAPVRILGTRGRADPCLCKAFARCSAEWSSKVTQGRMDGGQFANLR